MFCQSKLIFKQSFIFKNTLLMSLMNYVGLGVRWDFHSVHKWPTRN